MTANTGNLKHHHLYKLFRFGFVSLLFFSTETLSKHLTEPIDFYNNDIKLAGELLLPIRSERPQKRLPAVIVVHGSGENDRYNWQEQTEFLIHSGFAIFRFDKRGSGESEGIWTDSRIEDFGDDINAAYKVLADHISIDSSRIGIWGGSQGYSVGAVALAKIPKLAFGILASGYVGQLWYQDEYRFVSLMKRQGYSDIDISRFRNARNKLNQFIRGEIEYSQVEAIFYNPENQNILKFLSPDERVFPENHPGIKFWQLNINFDNRTWFQKIKVPLLTIWGSKDDGVDVLGARIETELNYEGTNLKSVILPSADHGLYFRKEPGPGWADRESRILHPLYKKTIREWLKPYSPKAFKRECHPLC